MPTDTTYDAFLSHSHQDAEIVKALAKRLEDDADLRVWLDRRQRGPREPLPEELEEALDASQTVVVLLGPSGSTLCWDEEISSALEERARDASRRVIPVLLPGAPDPRTYPLPPFLKRLRWIDVRAGLDDGKAFHRLVAGIRGEDERGAWPPQWQEGLARYLEQIVAQHATIRVLGQPEPVPLQDIQFELYLLYKPNLTGAFGVGQFQEDLSAQERDERTRVEGLAFMAELEAHRTFILGKPGAGKTTFLRYLALQAAHGKLDKVPILISLREWSSSGLELMPYIARQFERCGFADAGPWIEHALEHGRALALFDGLDEVDESGGQRARAIAALRAFARQYLNSPCAISARVAETEAQFEQFAYLEVAGLTDGEVDAYVRRWFAERPKIGAQLLMDLVEEEHQEVRALARTPLQLSLLCLAAGESGRLPQGAADLYGEALDALLSKWDASRGLGQDEVYRGMPVGQRQRLLARIAADTFERGADRIPRRQLERQIVEGIRALVPGAAEYEGDGDDRVGGEALLAAIEVQHGVLVEHGQGIYAFAHRTLQEYLTAWYVVEHAERGTLVRLIEDHLTDARWRGVFEWTARLLEDADVFFERFAEGLDGLAREKAVVVELLNWAEEGATLEGSHQVKPAAMRGLLLARALDLSLDLVRALARARNLFRALGRDFLRTRALYLDPDLVRDRNWNQAFAYNLRSALTRARGMARALARDRTRNFTSAVAHAHALDGARDYARLLGYSLFRESDRALERALDLALDLEPDLDHVLARAHVPTNGFDGDRFLDAALAQRFARDRNRAQARGRARVRAHDLELDHARDLALTCDLDAAALQHLAAYLDACRLYVACLEVACVSDREALRDRLLRAPAAREGG